MLVLAALILAVASCGNRGGDSEQAAVRVVQVEQVEKYTYLLVQDRKEEYWIAAPSMEALPGEMYTYQGGMQMRDFYSEELDRTFDRVLFVEGLFPEGISSGQGMGHDMAHADEELTPGSRVRAQKADVAIGHMEGSISVAKLYADPDAYKGKVVRVTGEVTKFNPAIMERNWVHLQDGTEHEGKFDLTATTVESFEVGDRITLEGVLATNLDFGYGYTYEILLENAAAVSE